MDGESFSDLEETNTMKLFDSHDELSVDDMEVAAEFFSQAKALLAALDMDPSLERSMHFKRFKLSLLPTERFSTSISLNTLEWLILGITGPYFHLQ